MGKRDESRKNVVDQRCAFCNVIFLCELYRIKNGGGKYCSKACSRRGNPRPAILNEFNCANCGAIVYRSPKQTRQNKSQTFFCNNKCQGEARKIDSGIDIIRPKHYGTHKAKCIDCSTSVSLTANRCNPCNAMFNTSQTYMKCMKKNLGELRMSENSRVELDGIRKWARRLVGLSTDLRACQICEYDYMVHVCHVRGIGEFPDDATVEDVNDFSNLSLLCPNHHVELDGGKLSKEEIPRLSMVAENKILINIRRSLT